MNFICGKLGKVTYMSRSRWSPSGGDYEPALFFPLLAKCYPQHTFFYVSKLNFQGLDEEQKKTVLPKNFVNIWAECKKGEDDISFIDRYFADKKIDGGVMLNGPSTAANVPGSVKLEPGRVAKTLLMFEKYAAPVIHAFNVTKAPWMRITSDARYAKSEAYDMINYPKWNYCQNTRPIEFDAKRLKAYGLVRVPENCVVEHVKYEYLPFETLFCLSLDPSEDPRRYKKDQRIVFVLNQMKSNSVRQDMLDEYFFSRKEDFALYGKWEEDIVSRDSRFKGPIPFVDLQEKLKSVKYSMLMPFSGNWITPKVYELVYKGVIPFFHPGYDTDRVIDAPEYLRLKNAEDFYRKCDELDNNPELYKDIFEKTQKIIRQEYFTGIEFSRRIMSHWIDENPVKEIKTENPLNEVW